MRIAAISLLGACVALEIGILAAAAFGIEFEPGDLWSSILSTPLALLALLGILRRRLWGWWCSVSYFTLVLVLFPIEMALQPEFIEDHDLFYPTLAALGVWSMIWAGVLSLFDTPAVRASVVPPPPTEGYFSSLPAAQIFFFGSLLFLVSLALYWPSGWYALAIWLLFLGVRRVRRCRAHSA